MSLYFGRDKVGIDIINSANEDKHFSEYEEKMQQANMNIDKSSSFVLLHCSDIHADARNLQRIVDFSNMYNEYIDDVIHTGDAIKDTIADGFGFWKAVEGSEKILNCIGNHDVWSNWHTGAYGYTQSQTYDAYIKNYASHWGVTYTENCNYYYKDYTTKKIRLIVLDCMFDSEEQRTWFTSTLNGAKNLGYTVVCAQHIPYTPSDTTQKAVTSLNSPFANIRFEKWKVLPYEHMNDAYPTAVDTFMSNGGSFACWLFGHCHCSGVGTLTSHQNQLFVAASNAGISGATCADYRKKNTKTQDSFNVVAIDTAGKYVKVMAVGNQYDFAMRHRDTMVYSYDKHELIYT